MLIYNFRLIKKINNMCWITSKKEFAQIRTAEKDIPVYKFLIRNGYTPYQGFPITFGAKLPKVIIDIDFFSSPVRITYGYHSYSASVHIAKDLSSTHVFDQTTNRYLDSFSHYIACYKAYIPKDTKYAINESNQIVSETLVVLNEIINADWDSQPNLQFVYDNNGNLEKKEYHPREDIIEKPVGICLDYFKSNNKVYSIICSLLDEDWIPSSDKKESHFQKLYGGVISLDTPITAHNASAIYLVREFVSGFVDWNMPYHIDKFEALKATGYSQPATDNSLCYYLPIISIEIQ